MRLALIRVIHKVANAEFQLFLGVFIQILLHLNLMLFHRIDVDKMEIEFFDCIQNPELSVIDLMTFLTCRKIASNVKTRSLMAYSF